jgi:Ser/Thr protein kinase RdoA (MazF antagonist)
MRYNVLYAFDRVHAPRKALAQWDAPGANSLVLVGDSQNFVYRFHDGRGVERYLRLTHESHRKLPFVQAELNFVDYLAQNGADVAAPVRSSAGNLVETVETPIGEVYATVFAAVAGEPVKWSTDEENRKILFERGSTLGRIHRLSEKYESPGPHRFHWYHDDLFLSPWNHFPESEPAARSEYRDLFLFLLSRPRLPGNYGMIHGDFGSHNTFRLPGGKAVAFDFDDCCYHWFLFDLAVAIQPAAQLPDSYRKPYLRVLLDGYASEKTLEGDGPAEVGMFCRLAALCRFTALVRQLDPKHQTDAQRKDLDDRRRALIEPVAWA